MRLRFNLTDIYQIIRFYQAAALNAAFGFSLYATFVWLGWNIYLAQIVAHCMGVAFNYFTYSNHVFRDNVASYRKFIAAYGVNYLVGLAALAGLQSIVQSPYITGFGALIIASLFNFFVLKRLVFVSALLK